MCLYQDTFVGEPAMNAGKEGSVTEQPGACYLTR